MTFPFPPTRFGATTIDLDGFRILLNALLVAFRFMQGCAFFRKALRVHQRVRERYLQLDLLAAEIPRARQGRDLVKGAGELLSRFDQGGAIERAMSCLAPQARSLLDQPSLGAMTRQQLWLALGSI